MATQVLSRLGGCGELSAMGRECERQITVPTFHPQVKLLEDAINYLIPTMVLPRINGKKLWRKQ